MAKKNNCRNIYNKMKLMRKQQPFEFSGYKLKEQQYNLNTVLNEIDCIAAVKKGLSNGDDLMKCTKEDMHIYLKNIPKNLAKNLGYHIIYGIDGLLGDGVSEDKVNRIREKYAPKIERLVDDCDRVANSLNYNIKIEYENLKYDQSETKDLVYRVLTLVDQIIIESGI